MVWLDPDLISFIPLYSNTKPGCKAPVTCPDLSISVSLETSSTPAQSPRFCSSCLSCLHHHVIPESRSFLIYNGCFLYGRLQLPDLFRHDTGYVMVFKSRVALKPWVCTMKLVSGLSLRNETESKRDSDVLVQEFASSSTADSSV